MIFLFTMWHTTIKKHKYFKQVCSFSSQIVNGGIDALNSKWSKSAYAVGKNGRLYELLLKATNHIGTWKDIGKPDNEVEVKSLSVSFAILVATNRNVVWRFMHSGTSGVAGRFWKMGKPNSASGQPPVSLSKTFIESCNNFGNQRKAVVQTSHGLYSLNIKGTYGYMQRVGTITGSPFGYIPAVLQGSKCAKTFGVTTGGEMIEFFD